MYFVFSFTHNYCRLGKLTVNSWAKQNDGELDLAMWDSDLGSYWGLVRIDASKNSMGARMCPTCPRPDPCSDRNGTVVVDTKTCLNGRRTGRFVTKDFVNFTRAVQVFNGTADYEIYTVQPFRLPSYRAGYYLATASFFQAYEPQEHVECELLQTTDYGESWAQVAPRRPFIPRGSARILPDGSTDPRGNAFDSHTVFAAWTSDGRPFIDPQNSSVTRFYYSGGNGPHSGQRDDSIGLARATTHAWAGLRLLSGRNKCLRLRRSHLRRRGRRCCGFSRILPRARA